MATGYAPPSLAPPALPPPGAAADPRYTQDKVIGWATANGGVAQPPAQDGSVAVVNPNGQTTVVYPDGTSTSQVSGGPISHYGPNSSDVGYGPTGVTDPKTGQSLTPDQVQATNNANAGPLGGGGVLGLGAGWGGAAKTTLAAVGGVTPGGAILGYAPPGSPAANARDELAKIAGGGPGGDVDTSPISAAAASAKALSDKFLAEYNAAHPGDPPVANAAQLPPAVLAAMPPAIKAGIAVQGAPVAAGHADASLIDPSTGLQFRQGQEGLIGTLNDAIAGNAPSVAALQLEQTRERNAANQLGLASKASGGGNTFLALQNAANQTGRINAQAGADAAILRAKEIMDARGQLGGVLDQARSGDIAIGSKNAELGTGVSQTNATNTTNANSETARLANAIASGNADRETSANTATGNIVRDILQGNQKAQNDTDLTQGKFTTDTNIANAKGVADQRSLDEKSKADLAANALAGSGQAITGTVGAAQAAATAAAAKAQRDAALLGAGGTVLAGLLK